MNELTDFEKRLYNLYLASLAKANNRPYKKRLNFDKLGDETYVALKKLSHMLSHTDVELDTFFDAPYTIHQDDKYKKVGYYLTPAAVKNYTIIIARRNKLDADSEEILTHVRNGIRFIYDYCAECNYDLDDYKAAKTENDIPVALLHLKQHKINFYIVHALDMQSELYKLGVDWLNFFISDFESIFRDTKIRFNKSTKLKPTIIPIIGTINNKLKTEKK